MACSTQQGGETDRRIATPCESLHLSSCQKARGFNRVCLEEEGSSRLGPSEASSSPWVLRRLFGIGQAGVLNGGKWLRIGGPLSTQLVETLRAGM